MEDIIILKATSRMFDFYFFMCERRGINRNSGLEQNPASSKKKHCFFTKQKTLFFK